MKSEDVESHLSDLAGFVRASDAESQKPKSGQVGKYVVGDVVGRGGQSVAMRGWDPDLERDVVLKIYHSAETDEQRAQVLKEGRALAQVNSPYVARCHTVETFADRPCLVLEHVPGMNLASKVKLELYSPEEAADVIAKIADGLEAVHKCGLVQRDLKPSNIVIQPDGTPKIIDFGLSTRGAASVQDTSGTAVYMPPERAMGASGGDVRGDIFGLGTILYEMLTGRPPFVAESKEQALENARRGQLSGPLPNPHNGVSKACLKCLCPAPANRFGSAGEVADAVRQSVRGFNKNYLLVVLAVLLPLVGFAIAKFNQPSSKIYWVDSTARANGNGLSPDTAFSEIEDAIKLAVSGDTIKIRGYNETTKPLHYQASPMLLEKGKHDGVTIDVWGNANPVARPSSELEWRPVLKGTYPVDEGNDEERRDFRSGAVPMFDIRASKVTIRNLAISGAAGVGFRIEGSDEENVADIKIQNCEVYRSRAQAIVCRNASRILIEEGLYRICAEYEGLAAVELVESDTIKVPFNDIINPAKEVTAAGISVYRCGNVVIDGNELLQLSDRPAVIVGESSRVGVNRSFIHDCGTGIRVIGPTRSVEVDLFGNLIVQCDASGILIDDDAPITELYVYYNTVLDCGELGMSLDSTSIKDGLLRNNLLMENRVGDVRVRHEIDIAIENNVVAAGRISVPDGFSQLGANIDIPIRGGLPQPQLLIQREELPPHEPESYAPLPGSLLIEAGRSRRLQTAITKCVAGYYRDPKRCDIGAVEHDKGKKP